MHLDCWQRETAMKFAIWSFLNSRKVKANAHCKLLSLGYLWYACEMSKKVEQMDDKSQRNRKNTTPKAVKLRPMHASGKLAHPKTVSTDFHVQYIILKPKIPAIQWHYNHACILNNDNDRLQRNCQFYFCNHGSARSVWARYEKS